MSSFNFGSVTRMHAATRVMKRMDRVATTPETIVASGDVVWVGDWTAPLVVRLSAVGSSKPRTVSLPLNNTTLGVWSVAAGADGVWATTPSDGALWRIDPKTNHVTRITIPFLPTYVAVDADGGLWVTVRGA